MSFALDWFAVLYLPYFFSILLCLSAFCKTYCYVLYWCCCIYSVCFCVLCHLVAFLAHISNVVCLFSLTWCLCYLISAFIVRKLKLDTLFMPFAHMMMAFTSCVFGTSDHIVCNHVQCWLMPSVLWCCWLGGRKGIQSAKTVLGCWHDYVSGSRCRFAYGPADATATHSPLL